MLAYASSTLSMATRNLVNMVVITAVSGAVLLTLLAAKCFDNLLHGPKTWNRVLTHSRLDLEPLGRPRRGSSPAGLFAAARDDHAGFLRVEAPWKSRFHIVERGFKIGAAKPGLGEVCPI